MKYLVEISEELEEGRTVLRNARSRAVVNATKIGKPKTVFEGINSVTDLWGFSQRIREACPSSANAYSIRAQIGESRKIQYYQMPVSTDQAFRVNLAYDPRFENNCIPGIPK